MMNELMTIEIHEYGSETSCPQNKSSPASITKLSPPLLKRYSGKTLA